MIEGEQSEGKEVERNDLILAIEQPSHLWADIKTVDDLGIQPVNGNHERWGKLRLLKK
jgi:hypothetical protein